MRAHHLIRQEPVRLTIDKTAGGRAHQGLGQVDMLRHGMGGQLLEQQLVHRQPQNGMHPRLQPCAGLASEVCYCEVQAALPAKYVGDTVCDLAGVPVG